MATELTPKLHSRKSADGRRNQDIACKFVSIQKYGNEEDLHISIMMACNIVEEIGELSTTMPHARMDLAVMIETVNIALYYTTSFSMPCFAALFKIFKESSPYIFALLTVLFWSSTCNSLRTARCSYCSGADAAGSAYMVEIRT